jgi:hypothetical protein
MPVVTRPRLCTLEGVRVRILNWPAADHKRRHLLGLVWLTLALTFLAAAAGCGRTPPVLETDPTAQSSRIVISGRIRGPERSTSIDGRIVELVNLTTLERHRAATDAAGEFAFKVQPGDYRVELTLRDGEAFVRQPGVIHVNRTDDNADADFIIGNGRASRPRPAYRVDDGLGSPVA